MQGPPACGYVPTLTNIYPIYGLNRRGEGTSLLSHLAILKGDGQHRTTKIPVSWFTLGSKPPSQLVGAGPVTRHNELKLTTKSPKNKASKPTDNGKRTTKLNPSGRSLFADFQRSNPSMALKPSKSSMYSIFA